MSRKGKYEEKGNWELAWKRLTLTSRKGKYEEKGNWELAWKRLTIKWGRLAWGHIRAIWRREEHRRSEARMITFPEFNTVEAVLFDVDGTLCDSDPLHYLAFRDMLQEVGFQGGVPITEEFFSKNISGKHNDDIGAVLFPDWDESQRNKFLDDKEALFRRMAVQQLKAVNGLHKLCKWIENRGLRRAAVTNAPRENAELMISIVGLTNFFELLVVGSECERPKPFPDPYLKALQHFKVASTRAFALEDSPSGVKAGVAAGLAVVGLTTRNPGKALVDAGATLLIKDFEDPILWNALGDSPPY